MNDWSSIPGSLDGGEFAPGFADAPSLHRRDVIRLLGAAFAMSAMSGCRRPPPESIVPHAHEQTSYTPGVPQYYATSVLRRGYAMGVLVRSDEGRPIKIEGNPDHPASLGATDAIMQAELLTLYDPSRSTVVRGPKAAIADWDSFQSALRSRAEACFARRGQGLHIALGATTSPTVMRLITQIVDHYPATRFYRHDPLEPIRPRAGAQLALSRPLDTLVNLGSLDTVVCLDDDLFGSHPAGVRYSMDFAKARREARSRGQLSPRLYVAEPVPTCTGARADERLARSRGSIFTLAHALAHAVGLTNAGVPPSVPADATRWIEFAARSLRAGRVGAITVGMTQPAEVHALALQINAALGSLHRSITLHEPADGSALLAPISECVAALGNNEVDTLITIGIDPVSDSTLGVNFADAMGRAAATFHLGLYPDRTAAAADWHAPLAHELESWGDARAFDGTAGLIQPLIEPLYNGRTPIWILNTLLGERVHDRQAVSDTWRDALGDEGSQRWRAALRSGVIANSASKPVAAMPASDTESYQPSSHDDGIEIAINAHPFLLDGRHARNAWLQELPHPITQQTWGTAACIGPTLAAEHGLADGDMIAIQTRGTRVEAPVVVVPGVADRVVGLTLGVTDCAEAVSGATCVEADRLRSADAPWTLTGAAITALNRRSVLALAQLHSDQHDREIVRVVAPGQASKGSDGAIHLPLYQPNLPTSAQQWGMTIDLAACTGCSACVVACQAENNIPTVGPREVSRGRRMHWIRVDRYYERGRILMQPLACVHCEAAPCELVCPTGATQHSHDGLNEMNYARCIGTRYCSKNCPYKARRFNFFRYAQSGPAHELMRNPHVTTRGRGVMEKCTYCVQRIRTAEFDARAKDQLIPDGAVVPACAQACPSRAITFGDVADPSTAVSAQRRDPRSYALLGELNTSPRTLYLADVRPGAEKDAEEHAP